MSARRRAPGPGRRVGAGTLRVDAGRAVAKLREYQLPDPTHWVLEGLRGLLAAGATEVEVLGDADEIWLRASGTEARVSREADTLAGLFDELVSPQVARGRRWLRLLATAVNTALGLDPRFVDVLHRTGEGEVRRIRYVPAQLAPKAIGEAADLGGRVEVLSPDSLPPAVDLVVHVRRPPSLAVVGRVFGGLFGGGELPELALLRDAAADAPVPVRIGPTAFGPGFAGADLLRHELVDLPKGMRAFLAVVDPDRASLPADGQSTPWVTLAEHGVTLQRAPIPGWVRGARPLPLRLYVDAERLPTNASRSQVRTGERTVRRALKRGRDALPGLVEALLERWRGAEGEARAALSRAALQLLAGYGARTRAAAVPPVFRPLLELPLLRDALGRPRTLASFPAGWSEDAVYQGRDPLPDALAPLVADLAWIRPGDEAARLFGHAPIPDAKAMLRDAQRSLDARRRWEKHPTREATVPPAPGQLVSAAFAYPDFGPARERLGARAEGIRGQVCLLAPEAVGKRRRGLGEVTLLLEDREIERLSLAAPWPYEAVVTAPGLRPRSRYDGIKPGARKEELLRTVAEVRDEALAFAFADADPATLPPGIALRGPAPSASHLLAYALAPGSEAAPETLRKAMLAAPIVPEVRADGSRTFTTLGALVERSRDRPWVYARPEEHAGEGRPPAGRTALCLSRQDATRLAAFVAKLGKDPRAPEPHLQPYRLRAPEPTPLRQLARYLAVPGVALVFVDEAEDHRGVVAWGVRDQALHLFHRGSRIGRIPWTPELGPCAIALDDDTLLPGAHDVGVADGPPERSYLAWEAKALMALVKGIAGEPPDELLFEGDLARATSFHRAALLAAASPRAARVLDEPSRELLRTLPLVRVHGRRERVSLATLREESHVMRWLPEASAPAFPTPDFAPVLADEELARALARLGGLRAKDVRAVAEKLHEDRERNERLARLRRQPTRSLPDADARSIRWGSKELELWTSLSRGPGPPTLEVVVRVEGRELEVIRDRGGLPLRCIVDGPLSLADEALSGVAKKERRRLLQLARNGAGRLLVHLAQQSPDALQDDPATFGLLARCAPRIASHQPRVRDALAAAPIWRAIQGSRTSLDAASTKARLRVGEWSGAWLGPEGDEPTRAIDQPVLRLPPNEKRRSELVAVWRQLAVGKSLSNHTRAIRALQGERMIARGLVPVPTLSDVDETRKRPLLELLPASKRRKTALLGPGELGLVPGGQGQLRAFVHGEAVATKRFLFPLPVALAVESPRLGDAAAKQTDATLQGRLAAQLAEQLEPAVGALLRKTLLAREHLEGWERNTLRAALLGGFATPEDAREAAIFETTANGWASLADLAEQQARHGDVWVTTELSVLERTRVPYDPERLALRLTPSERDALAAHATLKDAAAELRLDDQLRKNLRRAKRTDFSLRVATLGSAKDIAWKGAKGTLALLRPGDARDARVSLHREGVPLGSVQLPGTWPTLALIDDPKLTPDRVHGAPQKDERYHELLRHLRDRSDALLHEHGPMEPPEGCLAGDSVRAKASRRRLQGGSVAVGHLFLPPAVHSPGVQVRAGSLRTMTPSHQPRGGGRRRHLAVAGTLWAYLPGESHPLDRLQELVRGETRKLLAQVARELVKNALAGEAQDLALAHLLRAASIGFFTLQGKVRRERLPTFVEATTLADALNLLKGDDAVLALRPDEVEAPRAPQDEGLAAYVDDGGHVAGVLREALGDRLRRPKGVAVFRPAEAVAEHRGPTLAERAPEKWRRMQERLDGRRREREEAPPPPEPAPKPRKRARPAHALDPLAEHLHAMLTGLALPDVREVVVAPRRKGPLLRFTDGRIELAGASPQLVALQAARLARDPRAETGVRILAAHAVGTLERALVTVTGSTHRGAAELLLSV